jgi:hypothetical protein
LKGEDFLRPTAKQLFLEVSPLLDEPTATRALMEKEFFSSIRLSNGVHKTTAPLRLDDANRLLIAVGTGWCPIPVEGEPEGNINEEFGEY